MDRFANAVYPPSEKGGLTGDASLKDPGNRKVVVGRCWVPVIGGLDLYVVPSGAWRSGLPQCLPDASFRPARSPVE